MSSLTPTTELDAVNSMLATIGERPVNSLDGVNRVDVIMAQQHIKRTSRTVQTRGWWFNLEAEVLITPSVPAGQYLLPGALLKVVVSEKSRTSDTRHLVYRAGKLFHRRTRQDSGFTDDLYLDMTVFLDYEELPESARAYIYRRATIDFQASSMASVVLHQMTEQMALDSWVELLREELEFEQYNLQYGPDLSKVVRSHN